jgi:hypothetical protein
MATWNIPVKVPLDSLFTGTSCVRSAPADVFNLTWCTPLLALAKWTLPEMVKVVNHGRKATVWGSYSKVEIVKVLGLGGGFTPGDPEFFEH